MKREVSTKYIGNYFDLAFVDGECCRVFTLTQAKPINGSADVLIGTIDKMVAELGMAKNLVHAHRTAPPPARPGQQEQA